MEIQVGAEIDYICRVRIKFEGKASLPHYEHRHNQDILWYIPPFQVISRTNQTIVNTETRDNEYNNTRFSKPSFKHFYTVDETIQPTEPEKLAKRLKMLGIFS